MCVSTGNAATPKAWLKTTPAVLCPTPGSASSSSKLRGTSPPWRSSNSFDRPWIAFDLAGDRPQGLMISRISSGVSSTICSGVRARRNNSGVIWLTLTSVHCADSNTAINSV